jgi:hypothetical protein
MDTFEVIALATLQGCLTLAEKNGVTIQIRPTPLPKKCVLWHLKLPSALTERERRDYGFWLMDRMLKAMEASIQDARIRPNFGRNSGYVALFTDSDSEIEKFKLKALDIRDSEAEKIVSQNFMVVENPNGFHSGQIITVMRDENLNVDEMGFNLQNYFQHWDEVWIFDRFIAIIDGQWKDDLERGT